MVDTLKQRVLMINAQKTDIDTFIEILEPEGYIIDTCQAETDAEEIPVNTRPGLIFIGVNTSAKNGLGICKNLKTVEDTRKIPLIALSHPSGSIEREKVYDAGCIDFLVHPVDPGELICKVNYHFGCGQLVCEYQEKEIMNLKVHQQDLKQKLDAFLTHLPMGILLTTPGGNIIDANPEVLKMLGYHTFDEISDRMIQSFYYNEKDREKLLERIDKDAVRNLELRFQRSDGSHVWCSVSSIREKSIQHGIYFMSSILDITEKKTNEKEKETLLIQLAQTEKMASIGQLAAGVAHEINNPVGFVKSNINSLDSYTSDLLALIKKNTQLMSRLENDRVSTELLTVIKDINDFSKDIDLDYIMEDISDLMTDCKEGLSRIEQIVIDLKDFAHPGKKDPEPLNVNIGIESTLNVIRNELKYKVALFKEYTDVPLIMGIPQQINQVFMNILVNSAQSIDQKGKIWIKTRLENKDVVVDISDTGCGIPEKHLSKIFDPFFTTKKVGEGTGLGMNIAYNIVRHHNGSISVESEVGKGSTFSVRFPVYENTE